jgi:uncharacterized coiled-coil protein SlyX
MDIIEQKIVDFEQRLIELEARFGEHVTWSEDSFKGVSGDIVPLQNWFDEELTLWEQRLQVLEGRFNKLSPELNYKLLNLRITAWRKEIEKLEAKLDVVHKLAERIACLEDKITVPLLDGSGMVKDVHFRTAIKYLLLLNSGEKEKAKEFIENA